MTEIVPLRIDTAELERLRDAAESARVMHWAPYTEATVVAAVRTVQGGFHGGSNVEISNISLSKHAEESATLAALAAGALVGSDGTPEPRCISAVYTTAAPCGSCRQFLLEFATEDCRVYIESTPGAAECLRFHDLLPHAFGPEQQQAAGGRTARQGV